MTIVPRLLVLVVAVVLSPSGALAGEFSFAGLGVDTTVEQLRERYPRSSMVGSYMYVVAADSHDHIYGIGFPAVAGRDRLRVGFERPDATGPVRSSRYPTCAAVRSRLEAEHGRPDRVEQFTEERALNRRYSWKGKTEVMTLHCFRMAGKTFLAEALTIEPAIP